MLPGTDALRIKYQGALPALIEKRTDLNAEAIRTFVRRGTWSMPPFRPTELTEARHRRHRRVSAPIVGSGAGRALAFVRAFKDELLQRASCFAVLRYWLRDRRARASIAQACGMVTDSPTATIARCSKGSIASRASQSNATLDAALSSARAAGRRDARSRRTSPSSRCAASGRRSAEADRARFVAAFRALERHDLRRAFQSRRRRRRSDPIRPRLPTRRGGRVPGVDGCRARGAARRVARVRAAAGRHGAGASSTSSPTASAISR